MNQDRIPVVQTDPLVDKIQERNNKPSKEHDVLGIKYEENAE